MFSKIAANVVSGAIGLLALYVVGRLAYKAGSDMAKMEQRYRNMAEKTADLEERSKKIGTSANEKLPPKEPTVMTEEKNDETSTDDVIVVDEITTVGPAKKGGFFSHLKGLAGRNKVSVLKELFRNPEGHKMEACVNDGAVDIRITKRGVVGT